MINQHVNGQLDLTTMIPMWTTLTPGEYCDQLAQQTMPGVLLTPGAKDDYEAMQDFFSDIEKQAFETASSTLSTVEGLSFGRSESSIAAPRMLSTSAPIWISLCVLFFRSSVFFLASSCFSLALY